MPIAATNFANSCKPCPQLLRAAMRARPCLNEKEAQNANNNDKVLQTQKTSRHRRAQTTSDRRGGRRLRRARRTEHETLARALDRVAASCRRGHGNYRVQRAQDASGVAPNN